MRWKLWRRRYPMRTYRFWFQGQYTGRMESWTEETSLRSQAIGEAEDYLERRYCEPFKLVQWDHWKHIDD